MTIDLDTNLNTDSMGARQSFPSLFRVSSLEDDSRGNGTDFRC